MYDRAASKKCRDWHCWEYFMQAVVTNGQFVDELKFESWLTQNMHCLSGLNGGVMTFVQYIAVSTFYDTEQYYSILYA